MPDLVNEIKLRKDVGWSAVPNGLLENPSMSWKAKAIWAYLNSRPDGWIVRESDLVARSTDGKAAIRSGIAELEAGGYLRREQVREGGRYVGVEYCLLAPESAPEQVHLPLTDFPSTEKPTTEKPTTENRPLNNTKANKKDDTNTHDRALYARHAIHWLSIYPERDTPQDKARVIRAYIQARESGASEQELIDAAGRYRGYCAGRDMIGSQYVMTPARFVGSDVWREWLEYEAPEVEPDVVVSADGTRFVR